MATLKTGTTIAGSTAWHAGNDGTGSGVDADTVDGLDSTAFAPSQVATTAPAARFVGDVFIDNDSWPREWSGEWRSPLLINGWVNYGAEWGPARYRKTLSGMVFCEGLVKGGSGVIFMFPIYFRPPYAVLTSSICNPNVPCRMDIYQTGEVAVASFMGGDNAFVSLCFSFYTGNGG